MNDSARPDRTIPAEWTPADALAELQPGVVQLWLLDGRLASSTLKAACFDVLTPDEQVRASRMRLVSSREEFILGRALLRLLLGRVLGREAGQIEISTTALGKPEVAGVDFNVSHSGGVILVGISAAGPIGVDLERIDDSIAALEIARTAFSAREQKKVSSAQGVPDQARAFYEVWVRKEALLKAQGAGLTVEPNTVDTLADHGQDGAEADWTSRWILLPVPCPHPYVAAIAVLSEGNAFVLKSLNPGVLAQMLGT